MQVPFPYMTFKKQNTCILISIDLDPVLTRQTSEKRSLHVCPQVPFKMFFPEYFCPNHLRSAQTFFKHFCNRGAAAPLAGTPLSFLVKNKEMATKKKSRQGKQPPPSPPPPLLPTLILLAQGLDSPLCYHDKQLKLQKEMHKRSVFTSKLLDLVKGTDNALISQVIS